MRNIIFSSILLIISLASGSAQAEQQSSLTYMNYVNQNGCFSVDVPSTWRIEVIGEDDDIAAVSPAENAEDKSFESVEIWVDPLENSISLEDYYAKSVQALEKHSTKFELTQSGSRIIDGHESRWFRAVLTRGGVTAEILQYQMILDERIYIINFTAEVAAYARYEAIFEAIIGSFRLEACAQTGDQKNAQPPSRAG